ncbi:MAG: hypothetical protein IPK20_26170 [Betaproteobacteria bacterium]|nr:hypothetical protein [Betaproteobacteria bacterium]
MGLQQQIDAAEAKKADLNKRIGGVEAQDAIRTGHATQLAEAEQKAATLSRHKTALAETESQLADAKASSGVLDGEGDRLRDDYQALALPIVRHILEHGTADGADRVHSRWSSPIPRPPRRSRNSRSRWPCWNGPS